MEVAGGSSIDLVRTEFLGRIAERDTRLLSIQVLLGVLRGHTEEEVNEVNAPALARERGIEVVEMKRSSVRDYSDLVRVTVESGDESVLVAGTLLGRRNRAHLLEVWGQRFNIQLEDHVTLFRYRDMPGMIGRVGTHFGEHGINIVSAAVGRHPGRVHVGAGARGGDGDHHRCAGAAVGDRRDRDPRRVRGRSRRDLVACAAAPGIACAGGPGIVR